MSSDDGELPARSELKSSLETIIKEITLEKLTSRLARQKLEAKLGVSVANHKQLIDEIIKEIVDSLEVAESASSDSDDVEGDAASPPRTKRATAPSQPAKKAKKSESSAEENDDDSDADVGRPRRKKARRAPATKSTAKKGARKSASGWGKLSYISPDLANVTGQRFMRRCDVVKFMWKYIKENELNKGQKKGRVKCDAALQKVIGGSSFHGFSMMKYLSSHITDTKDIPDEDILREAEEAQAEYDKKLREEQQNEIKDSDDD